MDIIARRSLEGEGQMYELQIGRPQPDASVGGFACEWALVDESGVSRVAGTLRGVDSVDALVYAIAIIGDHLAAEGIKLTWHGLPGTGLPRHVDPKARPGVISIFASPS